LAYLILIFFLHFFIGQFIELSRNKWVAYIFNTILLATVFFFVLGVRDTADKIFFEWFYDNDWEKIDPMFIFLSRVMNSFGYDYHAFYQLHLVIYTLSFYFFISRYTKNIFYVFLVFFVLYYVPYVNQIRYYLGFPFFLLSIHYIVGNRKLVWGIVFGALAILSHSAITLLYGFLLMYYLVPGKKFFRVATLSSGVAFLLVMVLFQMGIVQQIEHFGDYFDKEMTSSVLGGVFNSLPYFMYIFYLYFLDIKYRRKNPDFAEDKKYLLLSKFSFFTIVFIPASFFVQVLGHRYVFPFLIVWMIYFLYMIRDEAPRRKFVHFFVAGLVHLFVGYMMYVLPHSVLGESFYEQELVRALKSVKYIKSLSF